MKFCKNLHHKACENGTKPVAFQLQDIATIDTMVLELIDFFEGLLLVIIQTLRDLSLFVLNFIRLILLSLHLLNN